MQRRRSNRSRLALMVILTALALSLLARPAAAQEDVRRCFDGKQYAEVIQLLQDWNDGKLRLAKADLTPGFEEYVKDNAPRMPEGWGQRQRGIWSRLPELVEPKVKLAPASQFLLLSLYSEQASAFMKQPTDERHRTLQRSLFIILGYAQNIASGAATGAINPSAVMRALISADCGYFPFCDPAKRVEDRARQP